MGGRNGAQPAGDPPWLNLLMLSESHSSFHIELQPTFFVKTDVQLFCRGNNGC